MKALHKLILTVGLAVLVTACGRESESLEIPPGTQLTIKKHDGVEVRGALVEVRADHVVVDSGGTRTEIPRRDIRSLDAVWIAAADAPRPSTLAPQAADRPQGPAAAEPAEPDVSDSGESRHTAAAAADREPEYREITIPAGTLLPATLQSPIASDEARPESAVRATLRRPLTIGGLQALPAGTTLHGYVTAVERAGRVKGRASVSFRFSRLDGPDGVRRTITSSPITRIAPGTKKRDAAKIGAGAAGGAIVGGILGGGDGAAKGAAVGGAAGTGVVLSTRGDEVRLEAGTPLSVRLTAPLTVRVRTSG